MSLYLARSAALVFGTSLLWSWVSHDLSGRWMLGAAVTLFAVYSILVAASLDRKS